MKQIRKWIALCMAAVLLVGNFSGPMVVEAKSSKAKVTLKIGKTNYAKKTCQLVKGQKVSVKVKTSNLKGKKITYSSSRKKIVSVSPKGRIQAKKKGTVKIKVTVTSGKKKTTSWLKVRVVNKAKSPRFDYKKKTAKLNSGYSMPLNGIGTYSLKGDECVKSVSEALKRGVRLIDTAYMYDNEREVGKAVRESGIPRKEMREFLLLVSITPAVVQNEIHPYYQESKVIDYVHSLGIVMEGWYPFGGRGCTKEMLPDKTMAKIAKAHGKSVAQVILRWNLQKCVVVIPGSSNPAHIQENTEIYDFQLSKKEMKQINALNRDEKHDWY